VEDGGIVGRRGGDYGEGGLRSGRIWITSDGWFWAL